MSADGFSDKVASAAAGKPRSMLPIILREVRREGCEADAPTEAEPGS